MDGRRRSGTIAVVALCLIIFESARFVDRHNRHRSEPRRTVRRLSIGRARVVVALFATTLMLALYSKRFDADEIRIIGLLVVVFVLYDTCRYSRRFWLEQLQKVVDPKDTSNRVLKSIANGFWQAIGTSLWGGVILAVGYAVKPVLDQLVGR